MSSPAPPIHNNASVYFSDILEARTIASQLLFFFFLSYLPEIWVQFFALRRRALMAGVGESGVL